VGLSAAFTIVAFISVGYPLQNPQLSSMGKAAVAFSFIMAFESVRAQLQVKISQF